MDSQFLRNLIFIPLTKVASAHQSINYFQIFWCHMIDETFSHRYIWKFPKNISHFSFGRLFKSVNFFFETLGIAESIITLYCSQIFTYLAHFRLQIRFDIQAHITRFNALHVSEILIKMFNLDSMHLVVIKISKCFAGSRGENGD